MVGKASSIGCVTDKAYLKLKHTACNGADLVTLPLQASNCRQLAEVCEGIPGACQVVGAAISIGCVTDEDFLDSPDQLQEKGLPGKLLRCALQVAS